MKSPVRNPFSPILTSAKPLFFTISAPAGAGKTTLVNMLKEEFPETFQKTVSLTTRSPRLGEVDGVDYHFISKSQFEQYRENGDLLEWVFLFGEYYGTSLLEIDRIHQSGKHCIAVIDVQGALKLHKQLPSVSIFISPPSQEELERRLASRKSETEACQEARLRHSFTEMEASDQFDYIVVNDSLPHTLQILKSIFIAEEHRNQ